MGRLVEAGSGQMRQATRIVPICLVPGQRFQRLMCLPAFDALHGNASFGETVVQIGCHSAGLKDNSCAGWTCVQEVTYGPWRGWRVSFSGNSAATIQNTDMRLLHRDIQASKIVYLLAP